MGERIDQAVADLQNAYLHYMGALKSVVDLGGSVVPSLIARLSQKHANPIAQALGLLLLTEPSADRAIVPLARSLIGTHPLYPDSVEALVRAGPKVLPTILEELDSCQQRNDDEGVRSMLDVAVRLPEKVYGDLMPALLKLLSHRNPAIREAAANGCWHIGLPAAQCAIARLLEAVRTDECESVRESAAEALARLGATL